MERMLQQVLAELSGSWRFRWATLSIAWVVGFAGIGVVLALPSVYEARAEVFVVMRDPLVGQTPGNGAEVSIAYVRRLLLSKPNLEQVARQTELDRRAPTPQALQRLVADLQRDISVRPGGGGLDADVYSIMYRDTDREVAQEVVRVLLNTFQEESQGGDLHDDIKALAFLDGQMTEYRRRLEEAESRVADFRRQNAGTIGGEGGFFVRLEGLQEQLREVRTDLRIAREKHAVLDAQFSTSEAESGGTSLVELQTQVLQAQKRLDELRLIYTDEHPSVIAAIETLATLQSRLAQRRNELGPLMGVSGGGAKVVENVQIALSQAGIEVTELVGRERDLAQRIDELQQRVDVAPQLEAELAGLNRDHAVLLSQYESLLERRERLSFDIDRKRQGRQLEFRIIEPPMAPISPVGPNRILFLSILLALAMAAGAGAAVLLHRLRPAFANEDMVYQQLGVPVLGTVSMAWTQRALWARRRSEALFFIGVLCYLGIFGAVVATMPHMVSLFEQLLA